MASLIRGTLGSLPTWLLCQLQRETSATPLIATPPHIGSTTAPHVSHQPPTCCQTATVRSHSRSHNPPALPPSPPSATLLVPAPGTHVEFNSHGVHGRRRLASQRCLRRGKCVCCACALGALCGALGPRQPSLDTPMATLKALHVD